MTSAFAYSMTWWLWSAWIENPRGAKLPLYSFAAQTEAEVAPIDRIELPLPSGAKLVKAETRLLQVSGDEWLRQNCDANSEIRIDEVLRGAPRLVAGVSRETFCSAFGQSAAKVQHYTGGMTGNILIKEFPDVRLVIEFLCQELGLNFRKEFAGHLGGFDVFKLKPPFGGLTPFECQVIKDGGPSRLRLVREDASCRLSVCVRMDSLGEVVTQKLVTWADGDVMLEFAMGEYVDRTNVEVYDVASGELVYQDDTTYAMEIHVDMGIAGRTLHHQDTLSRRAASLGQQGHRRASQTTAQTRQHMSVGTSDLRSHVRLLQATVAQITGWSADRWFARGVGEELDVIDHMNSILNDAQIDRAILVDPFFGEEALRRFVLRIQNSDLKLSVIMSWGRTDPDTAKPVPGSARPNHERLADLIRAISPVIACGLKVLNLVTGNGEQAFHDRYLAIYRRSGECDIWSLSNSINAMAANWPFCMTQLTGLARWHAQRYLEGLESGNDPTSTKTISATYRWPEEQ